MSPVYSTTSVRETRTVEFSVSHGPVISHPSLPGRIMTLTLVTVEMDRAVRPARSDPAMKTLLVAGIGHNGEHLHGSYPEYRLTIPQNYAEAVPPLVLDLLRVALKGWTDELNARGSVTNQVANVSGGAVALQAHTINGDLSFHRNGQSSGFPFS